MCGVVGFFGFRRRDEEFAPVLRRMAGALAHRGPDDEGTWHDAEAGVGLSHRRLSILDLSAAGHQPMQSPCGRYVISFNGEIYNFRDVRRRLEAAGESFRSESDTEVLLRAIAVWGIDRALRELNGMFAFAVWDRQERALLLARDRLGQKPMYYGRAGDAVVFGSELKAFGMFPGFDPAVDRDHLALFVRHGYIPEPHTIWRHVWKLMPGTWLRIDRATLARGEPPVPTTYWDAEAAAVAAVPHTGTVEEMEEELDTVLRKAVARCMVSDVPIGAFLSGGIDSSVVVALMQAQASRPVHTFSIGFAEAAYNEAEHAKAVAAHLGTHHSELYVTEREARDVIPRLATIYDEPFADSSQIPTHLVSMLARREVTVSLSGDGGDELFGGYNRYVWSGNVNRWIARIPAPLRRLASALVTAVPVAGWDAAAGALPSRLRLPQMGDKLHKLAGIIDAATGEEAYWRLTSLTHSPNSLVRGGTEPMTRLSRPSDWPRLATFAEQMMLLDALTYLPGDILTKVDRAAMAVSLETRVPLLDHTVVEFAQTLPLDVKLRDGSGKWILRRVLDRYVPAPLIERPKMGFGVPIDRWLRTDLREWVEDTLAEDRLRREGYFDADRVRTLWHEHLSGRRNWQHRLWAVLMAQEWLGSVGAANRGQAGAADAGS